MAQAAARAMVAAGHGGSVVNVAPTLALSGSDVPRAAYSASETNLPRLPRRGGAADRCLNQTCTRRDSNP